MKKPLSLLESNRALYVSLAVSAVYIRQPQFQRFGLAIANYQHFEQHKAGTEHC